jgi:hypothetical protein
VSSANAKLRADLSCNRKTRQDLIRDGKNVFVAAEKKAVEMYLVFHKYLFCKEVACWWPNAVSVQQKT